MKTADTIINNMTDAVEKNMIVPLGKWCNGAAELNALLGNEEDLAIELRQAVAKLKVAYIEDGDSAAKALIRVEADDIYTKYKKQAARCERIKEFIRIAKHMSRLQDETYKTQYN